MEYMTKLSISSEMAKWDLAQVSLTHEKWNVHRNPNAKMTSFQESAWNLKLAHEQKEGNNGKKESYSDEKVVKLQ